MTMNNLTHKLIILLPYLSYIILIYGCDINTSNNINYTAKEISLKETLTSAGINSTVTYTDKTVYINYERPIKYEEDLIITNDYILGVIYNHFPNSNYRLVYEIDTVAHFTEIDSKTVKQYLEKKITLNEFKQKTKVYVR